MPVSLKAHPLKVCSTCRYWVYRYKGLCTRLNQGVGKFWGCEDWAAADDHLAPATPGAPAPIIPPAP
jgi:hypothetical protein